MANVINCTQCQKEIKRKSSELDKNNFCSKQCFYQYRKNYQPILIKTKESCDYCKNNALYLLYNQKKCCALTFQQCEGVRAKNSAGLKQSYMDGKRNAKTQYQNMPPKVKKQMQWNKGKTALTSQNIAKANNIDIDQIFIKDSKFNSSTVKKYFLSDPLIKYQCSICTTSEWQGKKLNLHLDHINGDRHDHRKKNLRLLCPNCHSQTDTYCRQHTGKQKITDKELLNALKQSPNIRQGLRKVGLTPKAKNYIRAYELMAKNGLKY